MIRQDRHTAAIPAVTTEAFPTDSTQLLNVSGSCASRFPAAQRHIRESSAVPFARTRIMMSNTIRRRSAHIFLVLAMMSITGCVEESPTIVTFDVELESTTFTNRLLTPLVLYRDGTVLDTLPASQQRTYTIGRKGSVRHAWRIIAPLDRYGRKAGVEPYVDLGVQYALNASYRIDNEALEEGIFFGKTLFTPLIANYSPWPLRLIVNYQEDDQVITDYIIPRSIDSQLVHAPYFYWHSESNVRLESTTNWNYYFITRLDTNENRQLQLDDSPSADGTGRTIPITVY